MKLLKEISSFVGELKENYMISNIIKNIPEFVDKVSDFVTKNTITEISEKILSATESEVMRNKKKEVLDFIIKIWDDCPNPLKVKLAILLYSSYIVTNSLYMFIVANGLIITTRFTDKEFDKKIRSYLA